MIDLDRVVTALTTKVFNVLKIAIPLLGALCAIYGVLWFLDLMGWIEL